MPTFLIVMGRSQDALPDKGVWLDKLTMSGFVTDIDFAIILI